MLKYFEDLKTLAVGIKNKSFSMQQRLVLYFLSIIAVIIVTFLILFTATGLFDFSKQSLSSNLDVELSARQNQISDQFDYMASHGLKMSSRISTEIEYMLDTHNLSFSDLTNNRQMIEHLEHLIYNPVYSSMELSKASGAYVILNTTSNTTASRDDKYRSGIYIRRISVNDASPVATEAAVYRGSKEVARKNKLELHSRWELEYDIGNTHFFKEIESKPELYEDSSYMWTEKRILPDTSEEIMLLVVPIIGTGGEFYGICGVEMSSLYFHLTYPAAKNEIGSFITVVAPIKDNVLNLEKGLCGADERGKFADNPLQIQLDDDFNCYSAQGKKYVGKQAEIKLSSVKSDDSSWAVAVLLPKTQYDDYSQSRAVIVVLIFIAALILLCAMSVILSRKYVAPITSKIKEIQDGTLSGDGKKTGFSELDQLVEFLHNQKQNSTLERSELPVGIREKFDDFTQRTKTLTNTEQNILKLYIEGCQIDEIPLRTFVSINTVKTHNKSIYKKLGVSSKDELMIYIDLLERCDRLKDIFEEKDCE